MLFTIRCDGHVLGSTDLDFSQLVEGQHSGWLHPAAGAESLLDAVSIGYASVRAWMTHRATPPNGLPLVSPEYPESPESAAISAAVAVRLHHLLTLHHADGSELPTRGIIVQDWDLWPTPWLDDEDPFEGLDDAKRAELEAIVAHDIGVWREMHPDAFDEAAETIDTGEIDDRAWRETLEAAQVAADKSRYQVHVQLDNPHDLPSNLVWLSVLHE